MQTQELLDRCEYTIQYQMKEIDRLRAELERRDDELNRLLSSPHASCRHRYGAQGVG